METTGKAGHRRLRCALRTGHVRRVAVIRDDQGGPSPSYGKSLTVTALRERYTERIVAEGICV